MTRLGGRAKAAGWWDKEGFLVALVEPCAGIVLQPVSPHEGHSLPLPGMPAATKLKLMSLFSISDRDFKRERVPIRASQC